MKLFGKWKKEEPLAEAKPFSATDNPELSASPKDAIGSGRKILVVDDNSVVLKAFELKLKAGGFQVLTATDGSAAVSCARQAKPDIIVLDINFPPDVGSSGLQWNGFNILQWLRRFEEIGRIPVIIITSNQAETFKEKALEAGAIAFFQKPINYEEFMVAVRRAIGQASVTGTSAMPPSLPS
ncbi:response regulator [Pedosphaera parvula]|uniref:Response regulator receiver protein n=1 Tax=Pedosphaera parvula (strain Ellin514) TaxID=320771 RepID=B9XIN4_PEDPL|nr:response regulator [Pedosphaera parvula]EEF60297.1 response regulator receiver protein [Pedosphaera parvula Ellin514]